MMVTSLLAAITGSPAVNAGAKAGASTATGNMNTVNSMADVFLSGEKSSTTAGQPPEAYLHVLLFNEQFVFDNLNSYVEKVKTVNAVTNISKSVAVKKNGYAYIYFSNESESAVWVDNLQLNHAKGAILEETHYYPFGLSMAGISSTALNFGQPDNKKLFNGNELQSKEFSDLSGLEWTDFNARSYDQQTGRFLQIDPEIENGQESTTPYQFRMDNPVRYNDPDGKCPICLIPIIYEVAAAAVTAVIAYEAVKHPVPVTEMVTKAKDYIQNNILPTDQKPIPLTPTTVKAETNTPSNVDKTQQPNPPSSPGKMQKEVERGQAPKPVDRVDKPHQDGQKPHVHYKDGTSSNNDGTVHDKGNGYPNPVNKEIDW